MPEADNTNCLGEDCTDCNDATFTMTVTEAGSEDRTTTSGESRRTVSGNYRRIE